MKQRLTIAKPFASSVTQAVPAEDERLADGLDHVVRHEDQEDVREHEKGTGALAGVDLGEEAEKAVEGAGSARVGRAVGRAHVASVAAPAPAVGTRGATGAPPSEATECTHPFPGRLSASCQS
jgi:hypothetical protein